MYIVFVYVQYYLEMQAKQRTLHSFDSAAGTVDVLMISFFLGHRTESDLNTLTNV